MPANTTTTSKPLPRKVGCVLDFDNWIGSHTGTCDRLDVLGIGNLLASLGTAHTTLCANRLNTLEAAFFCGLGYQTRVTGKNADPAVIEEMYRLADAGCTCIVLGSGDADYLTACKSLIARGIKIILVAKKNSVAKALQRVSSAVYYIDRFVASGSLGQRRMGWQS